LGSKYHKGKNLPIDPQVKEVKNVSPMVRRNL
jgi:hypothetical protein